MYKISIHQGKERRSVIADDGKSLLQIIREAGYDITAPCGGNGTCGKCRVKVSGEDFVTSCKYFPERDIELILPGERESSILSARHSFSVHLACEPGDIKNLSDSPHGIAIDIGTTTIVLYLVDLLTGSVLHTRGMMNPQAKYGADVISRIHYSASEKGLETLQEAVLSVINRSIAGFLSVRGLSAGQIVKLSITGNTTMLHLLLGVDPGPIALAPFIPPFTEKKLLQGKDLKLAVNNNAEVHILPSVSAYVGADIVAGLASLSPPEDIKNYLFLDIGTNGEMALVKGKQVYCCSTAAGPAFEGANIECGMGAVEGAISSFTDPENYSTVGETAPAGICGSGLIDIIAWMLDEGIISEDGTIKSSHFITDDRKIFISQQDIREVQLAKAAIAAGINILLKTAGFSAGDLDALFLAGGFGNFISVNSAVRIGLLPEILKDKVIPVGNASGTGAVLSLISEKFDGIINEVLGNTEYIELSAHEDFVLEYVMQMNF